MWHILGKWIKKIGGVFYLASALLGIAGWQSNAEVWYGWLAGMNPVLAGFLMGIGAAWFVELVVTKVGPILNQACRRLPARILAIFGYVRVLVVTYSKGRYTDNKYRIRFGKPHLFTLESPIEETITMTFSAQCRCRFSFCAIDEFNKRFTIQPDKYKVGLPSNAQMQITQGLLAGASMLQITIQSVDAINIARAIKPT